MTQKKRMALITNYKGDIDSATDGRILIIYEGTGVDWTENSKIVFSINNDSIEDTRQSLKNVCDMLSDCTAIIGTSIGGIYYRMFDKYDLKILEIEDFNVNDLEYLEGILDMEGCQKKGASIEPISPDSDGNYTFDLISAQSERPDLSSKMLLKNFFEHTPFISLELLCDHLPPWIIEYSKNRGMDVSISQHEGKIKAIIRRGCHANDQRR